LRLSEDSSNFDSNISGMLLVKLAWKNVWRNKHRSLITMASVFSAVVLAVLTTSLQDGIFDNLVKNVVSFHTGYLQIHQNGYWEEQILDNGMEVSQEFERAILGDEHVRGLTPRLESFVLASSEETTKGCFVMGVEPEKEDQITGLMSKVSKGAYWSTHDPAILVAEGLAHQLDLDIGDSLVVIGQGYHGAMAAGKYPVLGILKFGSPEMNNQAAYLPLSIAQNLFGAEGIITSYVLSVTHPTKVDYISQRLRKAIPDHYEVMSWEQMVPEVAQHIKTDKASSRIIIGILYLLITFGIFGTQLMMLVERRREFGMLIGIGMSKLWLSTSVLIESVIMVISACLVGLALSLPIVFYLNRHPIRFGGDVAEAYEQFGFEAIFPTSTEFVHFWSQALIVLVIGILLSLYPVVQISKLDSSKAIAGG
jgi:ABC-type lipoprotein release transport system permease subunit